MSPIVDSAILDLDGTVYRGGTLLPGADEVVAPLRADSMNLRFVRNKPFDR